MERPYVNALPSEALSERFVRSRGPGGQNVNKVATAVQLRLDIAAANLAPAVNRRLLANAPHLANKDKSLTIFADRFRSQLRNRDDALDRLERLLDKAHQVPKKRVATRPSRASKEKRLARKNKRSLTKAQRKSPKLD
ncbi:MAG: alternative ribosome rescue aminoacyl-tRNA hydrolase ArfB [Pseudomonadales bacterium]